MPPENKIWEGVDSKMIHKSGDLPNIIKVTFGGKENLNYIIIVNLL